MKITRTCQNCGENFLFDAGEVAAWLAETLSQTAKLCPKCERLAQTQKSRAEAEKKARIAHAKAEAEYQERRRFSQLDEYFLPFSSRDPSANIALFDWVGKNTKNSILIRGETGIGKTRVLTSAALEELKTTSVYYTSSVALCDRFTALAMEKPPALKRFIDRLSATDLIVIDDFGKEALSDAKTARLYTLIDDRYTAAMQEQLRREGKLIDWDGRIARRGKRLWIATNHPSGRLVDRFGCENGEPIIRKLSSICKIYGRD